MRWYVSVVVVCLILGLPLYAADSPSPEKIDQVFAQWNHPDTPGCALAVIRDGRIVYKHGYGMANLELGVANTPQTVFDIGSVSKQFTAMATLLLVEDKKLSLDDDIRKHLPEIPDFGSKITIRHLLHHTSGLRDYDDLFDLAGIPEIDLTTDRDAYELIARQKGVNFKPGEKFLYSNTGYFLMSEIVKRVSGQTLRQFAQARIFQPLGMASTHFHDDHTMIVPRRATGYAPHEGGGFEIDMSSFVQLGDGSVMTTVEDLFKWDQNFVNPVVGGPEAIRELTTPGSLNGGVPIKYAMGLFIDQYHGLKWIHHSGEWVGYRAAASRFPDQHFSTWVTCNSVGDMNPMQLAERVADLYLAGEFKDTPRTSPASAAASKEDASPYAGLYWNQQTGAFLRLAAKDGKLGIESGRDFQSLSPLGEGKFGYESGDSEVRATLAFQRDKDGKPDRFVADEQEGLQSGAEATYSRVQEPDISSKRLAEYAGAYVNHELRSTWVLVGRNGKLIREQWMNEDSELRPAFFDGFIGDLSEGEFNLHFVRDGRGQIIGFDVSTEMVRPMRFERTATGPDHP
jgi:CubicO group peptidase (beta-lactamase class C family)